MPKYPDVEVELVGQDGNAWNVIALVSRGLKRAGHGEAVHDFVEEATSGDYDHLLRTAMKWVEVT